MTSLTLTRSAQAFLRIAGGLHERENYGSLIEAAEVLFEAPEHCQNRSLCDSLAALRTEAEQYCAQLHEQPAEFATQDTSVSHSLQATWDKYPLFYAQQLLKAAVEAERTRLTGPSSSLTKTSTAAATHSGRDAHAQQAPAVESAAGAAAGEAAAAIESREAVHGSDNGTGAQSTAPEQAVPFTHSMSQQDDVMCAQRRLSLSMPSDSDIDIGGTPPPLPPPVVRLDWASPGSRAEAAAAQQAHLGSQRGAAGLQVLQEQVALVPDTYEDLDGEQRVPELATGKAAEASGSESSLEMEDIENSSLHSNGGLRLSGSPGKPSSQQAKHSQHAKHGSDSHEPAVPEGTLHTDTPYSSPLETLQSQQEQPAAGATPSASIRDSRNAQGTPYSSPAEAPLDQAAPDQAPRGTPSLVHAADGDRSEDEVFEDVAQTLLGFSSQATGRPGSAQAADSAGPHEGLHAVQPLSSGTAAQEEAAANSPGAIQEDANVLVRSYRALLFLSHSLTPNISLLSAVSWQDGAALLILSTCELMSW